MALMAVEINSIEVIDGLWRSVYVIDGCGGLYICQGRL